MDNHYLLNEINIFKNKLNYFSNGIREIRNNMSFM